MCTTGWADAFVYLATLGLIAFMAYLLARSEDEEECERHPEWCCCTACLLDDERT